MSNTYYSIWNVTKDLMELVEMRMRRTTLKTYADYARFEYKLAKKRCELFDHCEELTMAKLNYLDRIGIDEKRSRVAKVFEEQIRRLTFVRKHYHKFAERIGRNDDVLICWSSDSKQNKAYINCVELLELV